MHELNTALGSTCEKYKLASPDPYIGSRDSIKCVMAYLLNIYVTPHPPHLLLTPHPPSKPVRLHPSCSVIVLRKFQIHFNNIVSLLHGSVCQM